MLSTWHEGLFRAVGQWSWLKRLDDGVADEADLLLIAGNPLEDLRRRSVADERVAQPVEGRGSVDAGREVGVRRPSRDPRSGEAFMLRSYNFASFVTLIVTPAMHTSDCRLCVRK